MGTDSSGGWRDSAQAWIRELGEDGDYGRKYVLDRPMLDRMRRHAGSALDIGCGEGRFCRMMQAHGLRTIGIDPTESLIHRARQLDPKGDYRIAQAETFDASGQSFDLIVLYLSLIDIPDITTAITNMAASLRPGGAALIANLTSFNTAGLPGGWQWDAAGTRRFAIDRYLEERAIWVEWRGIRIQTWHRPLSTYMQLLLNAGLELKYFAEPTPSGGSPEKAEHYRRVPWFHIMEWQKPPA
jgi:2-polyprenyl-3-methyl-5-hydroxy-6-metoxy-1,4-benzoquinol methylase